jgi:hypothetical protein
LTNDRTLQPKNVGGKTLNLCKSQCNALVNNPTMFSLFLNIRITFSFFFFLTVVFDECVSSENIPNYFAIPVRPHAEHSGYKDNRMDPNDPSPFTRDSKPISGKYHYILSKLSGNNKFYRYSCFSNKVLPTLVRFTFDLWSNKLFSNV